ncbi:MAG: hypothetical protein QHH80_12370 [Anaerolineae bacterium]|nr:hypothetical protein [Anaerolineae bacterium]
MGTFQPNPLVGFGILVGGVALAALAADARLALVALVAQYVGGAMVMAGLAPAVAWLHLAVGGLAALILYLGIRARPADGTERALTLRLPFRLAALVLTLTAAGVLAVRWPLPYASDLTSLACYALAAGFIAQMGLFREPARAGMATLTLLIAASVFAQAAGGSLFLIGLLLAAHLLTGLAAGHLHSIRTAAQEGSE